MTPIYQSHYSTRSPLWWAMLAACLLVLCVCVVWMLATRFAKGTPMIATGFWAMCTLAVGFTLVFPRKYELWIQAESETDPAVLQWREPGEAGRVELPDIKQIDIGPCEMQLIMQDSQTFQLSAAALKDPRGFIHAILNTAKPELVLTYQGKRVVADAAEQSV